MAKTEALAKFMFERQAAYYDAEGLEADFAWAVDPGIGEFWRAEAAAVIEFLEHDAPVEPPC